MRDIMHLRKSICAKRVVWYTNMASEKSCENAFRDISNSEFGTVSYIKLTCFILFQTVL